MVATSPASWAGRHCSSSASTCCLQSWLFLMGLFRSGANRRDTEAHNAGGNSSAIAEG